MSQFPQQPPSLTPDIEVLDVAPAGGEVVARLRVSGVPMGLRMRRTGRAPALVALDDDLLRDRIIEAVRARIGGAA